MNSDARTSVFSDSINKSLPEDQPFLTDISPSDKPWDIHKAQSIKISEALSLGYETHQRQAARIQECANRLEFGWCDNNETGETALKLRTAQFCRVRHCPICQWRRSLMWVARFYQAFPKIYTDHPEWRYIMVTFTVRNCEVLELRKTIANMNSAWKRLTERKAFPGIGYARSLEITRSKDNTAHPHYHCLIAVQPSYFGKNYLSTGRWAKLWQEALRVDYTPICDARIVKPKDYSNKRGKTTWSNDPELEKFELSVDEVRNSVLDLHINMNPAKDSLEPTKFEFIFSAIKEVIKYAVKPDDMLADPDWLIELSTQLKNSRAVAIGGEFRKYLKGGDEDSNQELIAENDALNENNGGVHFGWRDKLNKYQRTKTLS